MIEHGKIIREANGHFPFHFWIQKATAGMENGQMIVEGLASSTLVDHDKERMSVDALKSMARIINTTGVPLRVEHSQKDNAIIGNVNKAWIDERNQLWIKATLDGAHPAAGILYKGLKEGVKMGLSVGGYVKRAVQEMVEGLGKNVNTFYDVLLDEVSVTQRPSNYDARLMAKSFAKSEGEVDALAGAFESNEFLFNSAVGGLDYLTAFAKSIPADEWKDYKVNKNNFMETETKEKTTKAEETEETKTAKAADDTETTTKKAVETDETKTEKSVSRGEFNELVKMVSEGFNALTKGISKMAKMSDVALDQREPDQKKEDPEEGKNVNKASGGEAKDQEQPDKKKEDPEAGKNVGKTAADGTDEDGKREKAAKEDTYDLETVERAIKAIKAVNKALETDETKDKTTKAEETRSEDTETRKSAKVSSIDEFVIEVATAIERMEKSMKDGGFQTDHIAKSVINSIRSNAEFRKDIAHFMSEPGAKRSVINGTPFVKMKDGRMFNLTLSEPAERTEKSAEVKAGTGAFKNLWGSKFSSTQKAE
jgi:hypothetical protein